MSGLGSLDGFEIHWDSSEDMSAVEDNSVQSVITSPPYWDLKDYGHENQIGTAGESYEHYHDRMASVWSECYDVLRDDGTMWVVVDTVMQNGDLQLLPYHIAKRAEELGFVLQDMIIWHKPTAIAGMTDRNVVNKKEYVVYLSKQKNHKFRESEAGNGPEDPAIADNHRLGNLWRYPVKRGTAGQNVSHKAPYPLSLINRITKISTEPGDTILDPFSGSGTTAVSALDLDRRCIAYELNREFEEVIAERLDSLRQRSLTDF